MKARLREAYEKVKLWPEKRMPGVDVTELGEGFMDLLALRNAVPAVLTALDQKDARIETLEGALRELEQPRPELLSCHSYSRGWNDALFRVRKIARAALNGGDGNG